MGHVDIRAGQVLTMSGWPLGKQKGRRQTQEGEVQGQRTSWKLHNPVTNNEKATKQPSTGSPNGGASRLVISSTRAAAFAALAVSRSS